MKSHVKEGYFVVEFNETKETIAQKKSKNGIIVDSNLSVEVLSTGLPKNYQELKVAFVGGNCKSVEEGDTVYVSTQEINHHVSGGGAVPFEYKGKQYLTFPEYIIQFNAGK